MKNLNSPLKLKRSLIHLLFLSLAFGGVGNVCAHATDILPRTYFEQPLEPSDMVLNGMGQIHVNEYLDYKEAMGPDELPVFKLLVTTAGAYVNEADYFEPEWQVSFWGESYK